MPKITAIGTLSPANTALGGVPTLYYYDFASKGRGEVLRLFFEDAGIAFVDHRSFEESNKGMTLEDRAAVNPVGSVPYIDLGGKLYFQSYPILRHFARKLGKYDGKTNEEKYFADVLCDLAIDWRTKFVDSAFLTDKNGINPNRDSAPFAAHKGFSLAKFVNGIEGQLSASPYTSSGPFSLGSEITYADFVIYQIYHDEREVGGIDLGKAPRLRKLVEAVAARENVARYFESDRYYN